MLLKLLKYRINITYLPGKDMVVADTLSRSYIKDEVPDDPELEYVVHCLSNNVSMSEVRKTQFIDLINSLLSFIKSERILSKFLARYFNQLRLRFKTVL